MKIETEIRLKNGEKALLREARPEDAPATIALRQAASWETGFMARTCEEIPTSLEGERDRLIACRENPRALELAAFLDGELVGLAGLTPQSPTEKRKHRASFGVAVLKKAWGLGIGRALLETCESCARAAGYELMELDVVGQNTRARSLYEKAGYQTYGENPKAFRLRDGSYQSLVLMQKEL